MNRVCFEPIRFTQWRLTSARACEAGGFDVIGSHDWHVVRSGQVQLFDRMHLHVNRPFRQLLGCGTGKEGNAAHLDSATSPSSFRGQHHFVTHLLFRFC